MKYVLTILIIELAISSHGQTLAELHKRLKHLQNPVSFKYDTGGFSSLPKFDFFCDNENQNTFDYYHVMDLNQDGLKDLIYAGPCKKNVQTGIFINSGNALKKIYSYQGDLVSVDKESTGTVINILKKACCCDYFSEYIEIKVDLNSNVTKNVVAFGANTKVKLSARPQLVKVVGIIRTTPIIDDMNRKDSCRNQMIKGNHITRIEKFTDIVQLNQSGPWWLVLYHQNKERSWMGWMRMSQ